MIGDEGHPGQHHKRLQDAGRIAVREVSARAMHAGNLRAAMAPAAEPGPIRAGRTGQTGSSTAHQRPPSSWPLVFLSSLAWLVLSAIVLRRSSAGAAMVLLTAVTLLSASDQLLNRARCGFPPARKVAGHAMAAALALIVMLVLAMLGGQLSPAGDMLAFLVAVITVALAGGLMAGMIEAVAGSLLLRVLVTPQAGKTAVAGVSDAAVLGVFVAVAVIAGIVAEDTARRARPAASTSAAAAASAMPSPPQTGGGAAAGAPLGPGVMETHRAAAPCPRCNLRAAGAV